MSSTSGFKKNLPGRPNRSRVAKFAKVSFGSSAWSSAAAAVSSLLPPLPSKGASSKDSKGGASSPQPRASGESAPAPRTSTSSSRGIDSSPEASGSERIKSPGYVGDFLSFLSKDILLAEDRRLTDLPGSLLPAEASRQVTSEQIIRYKEKAAAASASSKEAQKELEDAKKCVADFELMTTRNELVIKQKENVLKLKETELKLSDAELSKKDQLLIASAAQLKDHVKETKELKAEHTKETEGLKAELEGAKRILQLKDEEISRLFDEAESQFDTGADSALEAIKSKFSDLDYNLLDQPSDQVLAPITSTSEPALGSLVPPLELTSSAPASASGSPPVAPQAIGSSSSPAAS